MSEPAGQNDASASGSAAASAGAGLSVSDIKIGQIIGRFRIVTRLGKGVMGWVVRADDIALQRPVALKLLPAAGDDEAQRKRVEQAVREARSAAQLIHPGIVQIYEIAKAGGLTVIAMEVLEGGSLEELVKTEGKIYWRRALEFGIQAADALAYAHERGIIHRDLKPANMMLSDSGHCKLTDFGLARAEFRHSEAEGPKIAGTPHYMAPEVLEGNTGPQTDIFALGGVLWFLLAGEPPYDVKGLADVKRVGRQIKLADLRQRRPDVPAKAVEVIRRALEADPDERYVTAREFAAALLEAQYTAAAETPASRPEEQDKKKRRRGRREKPTKKNKASGPAEAPAAPVRVKRVSRLKWTFIGLMLGAAITGAAWGVTELVRPDPEPLIVPQGEPRPIESRDRGAAAPDAADDGQEQTGPPDEADDPPDSPQP
mgnify:FL=1